MTTALLCRVLVFGCRFDWADRVWELRFIREMYKWALVRRELSSFRSYVPHLTRPLIVFNEIEFSPVRCSSINIFCARYTPVAGMLIFLLFDPFIISTVMSRLLSRASYHRGHFLSG